MTSGYCDSHKHRFEIAIYVFLAENNSPFKIVSKDVFKKYVYDVADRCEALYFKDLYSLCEDKTIWFSKYNNVLANVYKEKGETVYAVNKDLLK